MKIQARVSGKAALFTAAMLMLTSIAQYALDSDYAGRTSSSPQTHANQSPTVTPDAHEVMTGEVSENSVTGNNISLMIFRIN